MKINLNKNELVINLHKYALRVLDGFDFFYELGKSYEASQCLIHSAEVRAMCEKIESADTKALLAILSDLTDKADLMSNVLDNIDLAAAAVIRLHCAQEKAAAELNRTANRFARLPYFPAWETSATA